VARRSVVFPRSGVRRFHGGVRRRGHRLHDAAPGRYDGLKKEMAALKAASPHASSAERATRRCPVRAEELRDMNSDFERMKADQLAATTRMDEPGRDAADHRPADEQDRALQEIRGTPTG